MQQNRERGYHRRSQPFYIRGPVLICKLYLGSLLQFIIQIKSKDLLLEIAVDLFLQSLNFSILGLKNQHITCSKSTFCEVSIFFHIGKQVVACPNCCCGLPELLLWSTQTATVAHPNCCCGLPELLLWSTRIVAVACPNCYCGPPKLLQWPTRITTVVHPNCQCGSPELLLWPTG